MRQQRRLPRIYPETRLVLPLDRRVFICRQRHMTTRGDDLWGIVVRLNWHYNQLKPVSATRNPNIFGVIVVIDKSVTFYLYQMSGVTTALCMDKHKEF